MQNGNLTDQELIRDFGPDESGNQAFAQIVQRHGPMVYRICLRYCGTRHDAEDAAQNVFITLAQRAELLQTRTSLAAWLHRTACYTAMRWRRKALTRRRYERLASELRPDTNEGEASLETREPIDLLHRALGALPEDYRNAIILHHFEGYTIEEIAALLATRPGTVAARLSRGRAMLRQRLALLGVVLTAAELEALLGGQRASAIPPEFTDAINTSASPHLTFAVTRSTVAGSALVGTGGVSTFSFLIKAKALLLLFGLPVTSLAAGGYAGYRYVAPPSSPIVAQGITPINSRIDTASPFSSDNSESWGAPEPASLLPISLACIFLRRRRQHSRA